MLDDAEEHAEEDKKKKEAAEVRNEGESALFRAEKSLADYKDKIPTSLVSEIEEQIGSLKKSLEKGDVDEIRQGASQLDRSLQKIRESMQNEPPNGPGSGSTDSKKRNIEDAEVEIVDDEEKK